MQRVKRPGEQEQGAAMAWEWSHKDLHQGGHGRGDEQGGNKNHPEG